MTGENMTDEGKDEIISDINSLIVEIDEIIDGNKTYNKLAQRKYRDKNREKYNISQRELYNRLHQDEEWRRQFNERSKRNNIECRRRKREQLLAENPSLILKGRGRPRKNIIAPL